jgi:replicative DNA helicase
MYQPANDANQCLQEGLGKQWLISFYQAFKPKIAGITGSSNILNDIIEVSSQEKIALPPFLRKANDMLKGGLTKNTFNILAAHTSVGKSTFTNQMLYHLVMNCRDKVGIMSLEASKGVLGEQLLSLHLGKRISFIENSEERIEFINENKERAKEFFVDEDGNDRFYIMDDRTYLSTPSEVFKELNF